MSPQTKTIISLTPPPFMAQAFWGMAIKIAHAIFDQLMKLEEVDTAWFNHNIIGTLATDLLSKGECQTES